MHDKIRKTIVPFLLITFLITMISPVFAQISHIDNSSSKVTNNTFYISGPLAGLIFSDTSFNTNIIPPDILSGYWQLNVTGGHVMYFIANFSMVNISGYPSHIVQLTNFRTSKNTMLQLDVNGSISGIHGITDIKIDQHNKWNSMSVDLLIHKLRTIMILLPPISEPEGGHDLFRAKPITGLVHFFKDKNGEHTSILPTFRIR